MKNNTISLRVDKITFIKLEILRMQKALLTDEITFDEAYSLALKEYEKGSSV